jgi:hypothetical protein
MSERRYAQYPQLAAQLRAMTPEARELVAHWHRILTTALEGFVPSAKREALERFGDLARVGAGFGVERWLTVMRDVAAIIVDPSEADWCCKPGMLAHPAPCPQHGYDATKDYEPGTVIERPVVVHEGDVVAQGRERAVCVQAFGEAEGEVEWVSLERGNFLTPNDLWPTDGWRVVGHV